MHRAKVFLGTFLFLWAAAGLGVAHGSIEATPPAIPLADGSCFLLLELGKGEVRRAPAQTCTTRIAPFSTFKVPHALAALDSGVVKSPEEVFAYDGSAKPFGSWQRNHTLASAMRFSVLWVFQEIAQRLGTAREKEYLQRFQYGNQSSRDHLTSFWLGEGLQISPEEQLQFLQRFLDGRLRVADRAKTQVQDLIQQPDGKITNASGEFPFGAPWPEGTKLYAKTGRGRDRGKGVRWLVGWVSRDNRVWVFVSCVVGPPDISSLAAVDLAARSLHEQNAI